MFMSSESFIDNVKVEKGARVRVHTNTDKGLRFTFEAVCQDDAGKAWTGVARIGQDVILETHPFEDHNRAGAEAERLVVEKFVALLRG